MKGLDKLALKAKKSSRHFERLLDKLNARMHRRWLKLPGYVKFNYTEKGDLNHLVWEVVKKFNPNEGNFICFLSSNINFLVKGELKVQRRKLRDKEIFQENASLYRKPCYGMVDILAEREAFQLACSELMDRLDDTSRSIFKEKVSPSKRTIAISIESAFNKGGSDTPVRLNWKHIAESLQIPYPKLLELLNTDIMPMADFIFRKYGFKNPYEYRDGPKLYFSKSS